MKGRGHGIACASMLMLGACAHRADAPAEAVVLRGPHAGEIEGVAFSRDGSRLATADNSGTVVVWELRTRAPVLTLRGRNFTEVAFTPDAALLAAAGFDGRVPVWRVDDGGVVTGHLYPGAAEALAVAPDGGRLAAGGQDDRIHLWDLASGREMATLAGHTDDVYSVRFAPDGSWMVSGGRDRTIRVWDARTGLRCACSPARRTACTGSPSPRTGA